MPRENWCVHYTGFNQPTCKAGVNYVELGGEKAAVRLPCVPSLRENARQPAPDPVECPHLRRRTPEEIEAENEDMRQRSARMVMVAKAVRDDANAKGFRKGNGGSGHVVCPVCGGTVRYSIAGYNGHCHARCSTDGCAAWMQ